MFQKDTLQSFCATLTAVMTERWKHAAAEDVQTPDVKSGNVSGGFQLALPFVAKKGEFITEMII